MTIVLWRPAYDGSPPTWRIELALLEKGLQWEELKVSFDEKPTELFGANPRGQAPTLQDGEAAVYETNAILHYIEHAYPDPPLMPSDPVSRGTALTRVDEVSNYLMAAFLGFWRYRSSMPGQDLDPARVASFIEGVKEEWQRWEDYLPEGPKPYFAGDMLTLADLSVLPYLASCARNGLDLEGRYPRLKAFYDHMKTRPSVLASWPVSWKEKPGEVLFA